MPFDDTRAPDQLVCGFTAEDYAQVIADLFPVGAVWPRDPDSVLMRVASGMAAEFARVHMRDCNLLAEGFPGTATETISDWERVLGLPDPCTGPLETLQQRRGAIIAKMAEPGGQSVTAIEDYLARLGYWTDIVEGPNPYEWTVFTSPTTIHYFRAGGATVGERLRWWGNIMFECALERVRPAHTVVDIAYISPSTWDAGASDHWDNELTVWDTRTKPPPGWVPPPRRRRLP